MQNLKNKFNNQSISAGSIVVVLQDASSWLLMCDGVTDIQCFCTNAILILHYHLCDQGIMYSLSYILGTVEIK